MQLPLYIVDAFASRPFTGNPAGVVPLQAWPEAAVMQAIAMENNQAETAFFAPAKRRDADFELRWFTPTIEMDLCGHATLASAHVLFSHLGWSKPGVRFWSKSGLLEVRQQGELLELDFPARPGEPRPIPPELTAALGAQPSELHAARDWLAVFENEQQIRDLRPNMAQIRALDTFAVIASAPGRDVDFVSRFFAPAAGVDEDPVTGSAHCTLTPYWARRLNRPELRARQISKRGGELVCRLDGERVKIAGRAVTYLAGQIDC